MGELERLQKQLDALDKRTNRVINRILADIHNCPDELSEELIRLSQQSIELCEKKLALYRKGEKDER